MPLEEILPGVPAAQANDEVLFRQSKGAERVDQKRNQLGVGSGLALADNVGIELKVLAQTPFLLALVTEKLRQGEPFEWLLVAPLVGGNHSRQGGRHLRAQGHFAPAFVREVVELPDDFLAALGSEQF